MKNVNLTLTVLAAAGLALGACSSNTPNLSHPPIVVPTAAAQKLAAAATPEPALDPDGFRAGS